MKDVVVKVNAALGAVERVVLLGALAGMLLAVCISIGSRPLGVDVPWVTPLVLSLMVVATLFGAALATATRRHITMDLLTKAFAQKGRAVVSSLVNIIGAAITAVLTTAGSGWVRANMEFDDPISLALKLPDWWLQAVVPIGFGLCCVHFVLNLLLDLNGLATGDLSHLPDPNGAAAHGVVLEPSKGPQ